jgi:hypothetical protein
MNRISFRKRPFLFLLMPLFAAAVMMPVTTSHAGGNVVEYGVPLPPTEGRGCYYHRGEEYCGSYCYWEINGKRYCTQRLRHAHSQAGPQHFYSAEPRPYRYQPGYEILK